MAAEKKPQGYESYPAWILLVTVSVSLLVYAIGIYVISLLWIYFGVLFLIYVFAMEMLLWREGCANCYYYGKRCAFGRGLIVPLILKKGEPKRFCEKEINAKNMIPQMMMLGLTIAAGIVVLYMSFSWLVLGLILIPPIIWVFVNPVIYGKLACPNCKQGKICCPALEFFSRKGKKK